jgi:hypothetical protein
MWPLYNAHKMNAQCLSLSPHYFTRYTTKWISIKFNIRHLKEKQLTGEFNFRSYLFDFFFLLVAHKDLRTSLVINCIHEQIKHRQKSWNACHHFVHHPPLMCHL